MHILSPVILFQQRLMMTSVVFFLFFFKWSPLDCPWGLIVVVKSVSISFYELFVCLSQLVAAAKSKTKQIRLVAILYASLKKKRKRKKIPFYEAI